MARFRPQPHSSLSLAGERYTVQPHPGSPGMAYAAEGKAAVVYKLSKRSGHVYALKVFKPLFRAASLADAADRLRPLMGHEGLRAAERTVLNDSDQAVKTQPELLYAMLMPWIGGTTWNDLLVRAAKSGAPYDSGTSVALCRRFLAVLAGLEQSGIAHTDIAPGNVVVNTSPVDVQLLDLEDVYMPGTRPPAQLPLATPGYEHPANRGKTTWSRDGDRYSAAVLAAEILLLADPKAAPNATDVGLFVGNRDTPVGQRRFDEGIGYLKGVAPDFATQFAEAWMSRAVSECPRLTDLQKAIGTARAGGNGASPVASPIAWMPRQGSVFAPATKPTVAHAHTGADPAVKWTGGTSTTPDPPRVAPAAPVQSSWVERCLELLMLHWRLVLIAAVFLIGLIVELSSR